MPCPGVRSHETRALSGDFERAMREFDATNAPSAEAVVLAWGWWCTVVATGNVRSFVGCAAAPDGGDPPVPVVGSVSSVARTRHGRVPGRANGLTGSQNDF